MNLILLDKEEISETGLAELSGRRAAHILDVLHGTRGQTLRIGIINGAKGSGLIEEAGKDSVVIRCVFDSVPPAPLVDIILALPRPKVMKRLWAPLASLGAGSIYLTNAAKVERNYFDAHWIEPSSYNPLLIEGLEQAADTHLPRVRLINRLKPFIEDELESLFPDSLRLLAHPHNSSPLRDITIPEAKRVLLAIGPEGGWTDFELEMFQQHSFSRINIGPRPLRSDTACIALLSVINSLRRTEII